MKMMPTNVFGGFDNQDFDHFNRVARNVIAGLERFLYLGHLS